MKMNLICLLCFLLSVGVWAQEETQENIDPVAVLILDRMSEVIGELGSCSYTLHTSQDVQDNTFFLPEEGLGLVKHFAKNEVYMLGPDKMHVQVNGDKGHQGYWYNGEVITYYSYDENNFAVVDAPPTILEMMYQINAAYDIDFPAADFFNPYFTDDLLENSVKLRYLGTTHLEGKECFHIISASEKRNVQLWISNDGLTLPVKMVIVDFEQENNPQYEATFTHWQINPDLPEALFNFMPPPQAAEIILVSKDVDN